MDMMSHSQEKEEKYSLPSKDSCFSQLNWDCTIVCLRESLHLLNIDDFFLSDNFHMCFSKYGTRNLATMVSLVWVSLEVIPITVRPLLSVNHIYCLGHIPVSGSISQPQSINSDEALHLSSRGANQTRLTLSCLRSSAMPSGKPQSCGFLLLALFPILILISFRALRDLSKVSRGMDM